MTHDNSSQSLTKNTLTIESILTARQNWVLWEAEAITMADTGIYDDRTDFHGTYVVLLALTQMSFSDPKHFLYSLSKMPEIQQNEKK